jgi:hypothetical protein
MPGKRNVAPDRSGNKTLAKGERRFIAKQTTVGRHTVWGVYDRVTASWPIQRAGLGMVQQHVTDKAVAEAEADRCEAIVRGEA